MRLLRLVSCEANDGVNNTEDEEKIRLYLHVFFPLFIQVRLFFNNIKNNERRNKENVNNNLYGL